MKIFLYLGLICQLAVVAAFVMTMQNIDRAFASAGSPEGGGIDAVSRNLETAYTPVLYGSILGYLGFMIYYFTVRKIEEKKLWMKNFGVIISYAYLLLFPIGTILGISALKYFKLNSEKFKS